ncbi:hypothetical protein WJX84_002851 [Apatococcus fuscideae]|uniref:UBC core domain-containing protein n=1 Tax=Apatococcus fuscideae TaxID=2026836 RepID=A0AAW1SGK1_9CHLO
MSRPCLKRLLRDLKEVLENPLPDVAALPLENDLLVWHGNVRGREGLLADSIIHFVLTFDESYPARSPQVFLYQAIPHPNVVPRPHFDIWAAEGARWRLALWDCIPTHDAWCQAYTVYSILVLLQSFLVDEDMQFDHHQILPEVAVRQAAELTVEACGHRPAAPFPPLPTPEVIALAKAARGKRVVVRPTLKPRSLWGSSFKEPLHASNKPASNGSSHSAKRIRIREPQCKRIKAVLDAHAIACQKGTAEVPAGIHSALHESSLAHGQLAQRSMGPLMDRLPPDTLSGILSLLAHEDLENLSYTCYGMWRAAKDGAVWRELLHRQFPFSTLTASSASDWQYTYTLQATAAMEDLQCFFTKVPFTEDILGLPLTFTRNPKTKAFLPLYLTHDHFERVKAGRSLDRALAALAPEAIALGRKTPSFSNFLGIIPKMLNTAIVLIMDKGLAVSDRALATYCNLHRLYLALAEDFNLGPQASKILTRFANEPASRVKSQTPNLGWLIPILSLGTQASHTWKEMGNLILEEALDRNILWICKHDPSLQESLSRDPDRGGADHELLRKSFEASAVSQKLIAFHVAFLTHIARPEGSTLQQVMVTYDALYGRPSPALRMRQVMEKIMVLDCWAAFMPMVGHPVQADFGATMTKRLRLAWCNSLQKKYHSKGMNFQRVQGRGISSILLKGQRYTAAPNIEQIRVLDKWHFQPPNTKYLDATMFVLGAGGRIITTVDYQATSSFGTRVVGAVTHSGDVMEASSGCHTMQIRLRDLGANVKSLLLVLSAWQGNYLDVIKQPYVEVVDPATKMTLCEYHLEKQPKQTLAENTAVAMCRIFVGPTGTWQVEALGQMLPAGSAANYEPIEGWIAAQGW